MPSLPFRRDLFFFFPFKQRVQEEESICSSESHPWEREQKDQKKTKKLATIAPRSRGRVPCRDQRQYWSGNTEVISGTSTNAWLLCVLTCTQFRIPLLSMRVFSLVGFARRFAIFFFFLNPLWEDFLFSLEKSIYVCRWGLWIPFTYF